MEKRFKVSQVSWEEGSLELAAIRREVFIIEQNVPEDLEWDGIDESCSHVITRDMNGKPIGTGRLLPDGHIGRLAVLKPWRGRGVGAEILKALIDIAITMRHDVVVLHAQIYALGFYKKFGFVEEGAEFIEAGIPHIAMRRNLNNMFSARIQRFMKLLH